jgi:hypothetical protein
MMMMTTIFAKNGKSLDLLPFFAEVEVKIEK